MEASSLAFFFIPHTEENVGDGPFADFHMMNATLDYVRHGAYWSELFVGYWYAIWWTAASFDSRRNKSCRSHFYLNFFLLKCAPQRISNFIILVKCWRPKSFFSFFLLLNGAQSISIGCEEDQITDHQRSRYPLERSMTECLAASVCSAS
jgi:hypothetical protein